MTIKITAKGTTIRDPFRKSLEKKLSKLDRFFGDDVNAAVMVVAEGGRETVEVTIKQGGIHFRAEKTTGDRLDSLDQVVDALFRMIVKHKKKLEKRFNKTAFADHHADDYVGAEPAYDTIRVKRFAIKPMDVEEAILQMNMIGHDFYMFRNSDTDDINVVYKRQGGSYGVIEPGDEDDD
ncbi:MAG: ribosome-associated translation inhibitor RaiA [Oscillospiraceae bacterium]|nr:ribosome-associated translation inhibitor RaiA [Oscillospiraceae bacterium]